MMIELALFGFVALLALGIWAWQRVQSQPTNPFGDIRRYQAPRRAYALHIQHQDHSQAIEHTFEPAHGTLLESLERCTAFKMRHSCRNAHCGACCVELRTGQVNYFKEGSFPLEAGEVLACACTPASDLSLYIPHHPPKRKVNHQ